jgi:glycosyltransferase involved in cell wall biosynthesis
MRVFYDHQVFSLQNAGGAARYHYELIRHLREKPEVRIEIALGLNHCVYPFRELRAENTRVFGPATDISPGVLRYCSNEALVSAYAVFQGKYDVYHPTLYRSMPVVRRRRTVVTHHDCAHERFPELFRNAGKVIAAKRKLYAQADAIICVSEFSKRDLLSYYDVDAGKVFVVYHGFTPLAASAEEKRPDSPPYLLFVGFRKTYKNFDMLLKAYAESSLSREYELITVGGGDFSASERERITGFGLTERVKNFQAVSDSTLADLYKHASLFIYPSLCEGFGFPPLEAMSQGCPVLASRDSCIPEVCGESAFYFDPTDLHDLVRNLEHALASETMRNRMKANGLEQIKKYRWNTAADETLGIYERVCQL